MRSVFSKFYILYFRTPIIYKSKFELVVPSAPTVDTSRGIEKVNMTMAIVGENNERRQIAAVIERGVQLERALLFPVRSPRINRDTR